MLGKITLYNTKSKNLEDFIAEKEGHVGIYSCGPTVYHYAHIGNLRAYVFADTLRRTFVEAGYQVQHIINITDVGHLVGDSDEGEDKLEKGSAREGKSAFEVALYYEEAFKKDLTALNIPQSAYNFPRATDNIPEQVALIKKLEEKGHTYTISDGVYFDTSTFATYRDFAHLDIEGLQSGARVEENLEKRNITDFALWKFSPTNEKRQMEWESPWGIGFPGWHIECSAMSMKYLGNHFDIHTGGIDHIPVHHTNEIAQSESATGEAYANYWMHVNFLNDTTGKMSKSNEDFLTLSSLTQQGYDPLVYKYFLLTTHYRKEVSFSYEALQAAASAYAKLSTKMSLYKTQATLSSTVGIISSHHKNIFTEALRNDLNTSVALATIWSLIDDEEMSVEDKYATLAFFDEILGLNLEAYSEKRTLDTLPEEIEKLMNARKQARDTKNFQESDRLRDELSTLGFTVKDTQNGQEILKN